MANPDQKKPGASKAPGKGEMLLGQRSNRATLDLGYVRIVSMARTAIDETEIKVSRP
jgi:hypothetical protein